MPSNKLHSRFVGPYLTEKLNDLKYIMVTPDGRKKAQLCHIHMLQPYVERGDNLDEDPAQFNVLFF